MRKILILGVTGMLGHTLFRELTKNPEFDVWGTSRINHGLEKWFLPELLKKIRVNVLADNFDTVIRALASIQPDIVINCIGIIKQIPEASDPLYAITVNAQLPHRISLVCKTARARLIHISSDCVFSGNRGDYTEADQSDAEDLYGRTKYLGEVYYPHCVTLRTSIIGPELKGKYGLIEWFLSQKGEINGYDRVIYTGFPTNELANIISDYVIPNDKLTGLYHVSSEKISKYELLKIVAKEYEKEITIHKDVKTFSDRSLVSERFQTETGYRPPDWSTLIENMNKSNCR